MIWRVEMPLAIRANDDSPFIAKTRAVDVAGVKMSLLTYPSVVLRRTPKLIRASDPEVYQLSIRRCGKAMVTQDRQTADLAPGEMTLYNSSRPFEIRAWGDRGGTTSSAVVTLPRGALPRRDKQMQLLVGTRITARNAIGALLLRYVDELVRNADRYHANETVRLASLATEMISATLAHQLGEEASLPPETHQAALFAQIQAYVRQNLGDPDLSPQTVAATHHISTRLLYKLFSANGLTVAGWIRDLRLQRICRELRDPALATRKIHTIATGWGIIGGAAHFSRMFKDAHGMSPRDYREQALASPGSHALSDEPGTTAWD
jgi:AraC-like DNA-binding protein